MTNSKCKFCNNDSTAVIGDLHLCGRHLTEYFKRVDNSSKQIRKKEGRLDRFKRWFGWDWRKYRKETQDIQNQTIKDMENDSN